MLVLVVLALAGASAAARRWRRYMLSTDRAAPVERAIERLCVVADLEEPLTALVADDVPLSWTTAPPGKRPRVHVTTGMAELLDESELPAVLAHELSHIGNRDAVIMTVLAAPGLRVLRSLHVTWRHAAEQHWAVVLADAAMCIVLAVPAVISVAVARLWATHPPLDERIARLARLEARLQA